MRTLTILKKPALSMLAVALSSGFLACDEEPAEIIEYPVVNEVICVAIFIAETEMISADTLIEIDFSGEDGEATGSIAHSDGHGTRPGYLFIDGEELPINHRIDVLGTLEWTAEGSRTLAISLHPPDEVPDAYYLTLDGELDIDGIQLHATLLDAQDSFLCSTIDVEEPSTDDE